MPNMTMRVILKSGSEFAIKCDNTYHIGHCWWPPDEREGGNV